MPGSNFCSDPYFKNNNRLSYDDFVRDCSLGSVGDQAKLGESLSVNNHVLLPNLDETWSMSFICSGDEESDTCTTDGKVSNIDPFKSI